MRRTQSKEGRVSSDSRRGVVLIAVLWIVMALSIIVTGLTRNVRD